MAMVVIFFSVGGNSQISISNTKWSVHLETPRQGDFTWVFKSDSFFVYVDSENRPAGIGTFKQRNDSLLIHKVSGTSPCPDGSEGWYRIEWLENREKFKLHLLQDEATKKVARLDVNYGSGHRIGDVKISNL